jgi:hypothetical protein
MHAVIREPRPSYLDLSSPVLEPELDLACGEAELLAELLPLLLVWMRGLFEYPGHSIIRKNTSA